MNKNHLLTLIAATVISSAGLVCANTVYDNVILSNNPVSYWPMQETTGPTIHDSVTTNGGPFNGTVQISTDGFTNGATDGEGKNWGIIHETFTNSTSAVATDGATYLFGGPGGLTGISGDKAIYFTNLNGQLNNAQIAMGTGGTGVYESLLDASTFTVEAWIKVPTYTIGWTSNAYQIPLSLNALGNSGNTDNGWIMGVKTDSSGSTAYGELFFEAGTGTAYTSNGPSAQVFSGHWVYAVQEYNGTATVIYTNGTLMVSNAQTYKPLSNSSTHELPFIIGSQTAYYFGGSTFSGDTRAEFWDGGVSHVAYYNSTLTAAQIANHYFSATNSGTAPSITSQPASTTNNVGQTATFSVTASGSPAPSYQWKVQSSGSYVNLSNGGQYSGATSSTLSISSLALTNATNYEVVVTNSFGSVTSAVASLTVLTNSSGLTAYQTIIIADAPVAFWPLNETSGTTIHDIAGTNNGTVVNPAGVGLGGPGILYSNGVTSDLAAYFTNTSSGYISVPYNTNFVGSAALHLSVEAWLNMPTFPAAAQSANENPVSFCNGISALGWTFDIQVANAANPHMYAWLAKGGSWNSDNTGVAIQSKWSYYVMTFDGSTLLAYTNGILAASTTVTNYATVTNGNFLYLGDYNDGGNTPDTNRYYQGGMEDVAVYNYTLTSAQVSNHNAFGTNSGATFITTQPASQTNFVGLTSTFSVAAAGSPPLLYQWKVQSGGTYVNLSNGGQFSGVTNTTLTISSLALTNSTNYEVLITNAFGSVTSAPAKLTVLSNSPPSITTQPASQTNTVGQNAIFNVTASGTPTLHYQWQVKTNGAFANLSNGGQYSGVTTASATVSTLALGNAGSYDVIVTNSFGAVTSATAVLTVHTNGGGSTIKLMCIGDSITEIDECDWRSDLANELTDAGFNYLMVGRNEGTACPTSPVNQNHHEGYSGDTSSDILSMMPAMMAANIPDIAMIHIGANDLSGPAPNQTLINLSQIIRILQASNANMTIVVSQIIPCELCPTIWEYDYLIPQLNSNLTTSTSHVVNADVFDNFSCNAYFDGGTGPHPNAAGGQFMANVYYPIISSIMNGTIPTRPPLPPTFPGPSGYVLCSFANNGAFTVNFPHATNVAYGDPTLYGGPPTNVNGTYIGTPGGQNNYIFVTNVSGNYQFNNNIGDPDPGEEKFGYVLAPGIGIPGIPGTGGGGADWSPVMPAFKPTIQAKLAPAIAPSPVPNQFSLQVTAVANQIYTLQMCTDLTSPNWVSLYTTNSATNTSFVLTDPNATNKQRFYRVLIGP